MLRGIGVTLALPLLDGMVPALTALAKTAAKPVNRFGAVYVPNGMIMKDWSARRSKAPASSSCPRMKPLAPFRDQLLVLSNLNCVPMAGRPGGTHAKASTRFLTDVSPPTSESLLDAGISMDQILAQETGKYTQLGSLELGIESERYGGRLRHRICVSLHQHHLVAQRQYAAADAEQPARRVRAPVRRQREHGSESPARPPSAASAASWIP